MQRDEWIQKKKEVEELLEMDHYELLEVDRFADVDTVKKAFRELARKWHPDKNRHRTEDCQARAVSHFGRLQEAYQELLDPVKKSDYDLRLRVDAATKARDAPASSPSWGGKHSSPAGSYGARERSRFEPQFGGTYSAAWNAAGGRGSRHTLDSDILRMFGKRSGGAREASPRLSSPATSIFSGSDLDDSDGGRSPGRVFGGDGLPKTRSAAWSSSFRPSGRSSWAVPSDDIFRGQGT